MRYGRSSRLEVNLPALSSLSLEEHGMSEAISERQQYWLDHILAADKFNGSLVEYANVEGLRVKDLYQWKTLLARRGLIAGKAAKPKAFVPVRKTISSPQAVLVLPNGARIEFSGGLDSDTVKSLVTVASELG
jgi:hypothetical protein